MSRERRSLPGEALYVEPAAPPFPAGSGALARATGRIPELVSAAAGWRGARARAAGLVPGLSPAAAPPRPPLCFVSAGPRRCDSHFRSWRLEGAGWGGAGEAVRGAEGRGAGSGVARGRAAGRCGLAGLQARSVLRVLAAHLVRAASRGPSGRCHTSLSPDSAESDPRTPNSVSLLEVSQNCTRAVLLIYRSTFCFFHEEVSES